MNDTVMRVDIALDITRFAANWHRDRKNGPFQIKLIESPLIEMILLDPLPIRPHQFSVFFLSHILFLSSRLLGLSDF